MILHFGGAEAFAHLPWVPRVAGGGGKTVHPCPGGADPGLSWDLAASHQCPAAPRPALSLGFACGVRSFFKAGSKSVCSLSPPSVQDAELAAAQERSSSWWEFCYRIFNTEHLALVTKWNWLMVLSILFLLKVYKRLFIHNKWGHNYIFRMILKEFSSFLAQFCHFTLALGEHQTFYILFQKDIKDEGGFGHFSTLVLNIWGRYFISVFIFLKSLLRFFLKHH